MNAGSGGRSPGPAPGAVPLSLYVHLPWCVRKCPYCDFNSHRAPAVLPERRYLDALVADLRAQAPATGGRTIGTVFIGGGTPSLFSPAAIARVLDAARDEFGLVAGAEVTLEANPGASDAGRFEGYRAAGVTRLSIGVQSFDDALLARVGRVHDSAAALAAFAAARSAGFERINLDLMYALPGQSLAQAASDLDRAIDLEPGHVSLYQLTLEPGTPFHRSPPTLPDDELADAMHEAALGVLARAGYQRYEISAYARPGERSAHNLNYCRFGDYVGVGAGAHGKLTGPHAGQVARAERERHPSRYADMLLEAPGPPPSSPVPTGERAFEFVLNAARLIDGFDLELFESRTGLARSVLAPALARARALGLVQVHADTVRPTERGQRFHNDLVMLFMPESDGDPADLRACLPRGTSPAVAPPTAIIDADTPPVR